MTKPRHKWMFESSQRRLRDAKLLGEMNLDDPFSDSAALLSLLGFELLLKLVFELHSVTEAPWKHEYHKTFAKLPEQVKEEIAKVAKAQVGPDAFAMPLDKLLQNWSENFVDMRYPYDRERRRSTERLHYHPEELYGMIEAFYQVLARHGFSVV